MEFNWIMLEQDVKKPKKDPWRMPLDFRLIDFHKPLLQQAPVIFFILLFFAIFLIAGVVLYYE